jgi:hypothetical protein
MALSKFSILTPDAWTTGVGKTSTDVVAARFGHINRIVDYINDLSSEKMARAGVLNAASLLELQRVADPVVGTIPATARLVGNTPYLISVSNNITWSVTVTVSAQCTSGTASVNLGDSYLGQFNILFKRINGVSSVVGVNGAFVITDASMSSAQVLFTVGGANDLRINFQAPSTAAATAFSLKANVLITDLTY